MQHERKGMIKTMKNVIQIILHLIPQMILGMGKICLLMIKCVVVTMALWIVVYSIRYRSMPNGIADWTVILMAAIILMLWVR